ncbi:MAG: TIGR03621 family F420-dependent LLM class oxidoreductase [Chloroflexota bacterium]|nr:TIGR03621 family F420-dependent LLM class oxidoreductase [Chloroflexota bacterium]
MTPEVRPFRFGLMIDNRHPTRDSLLALARRAEAAGISVLLGTDHLGRWASLPLLQAAAAVTVLRVGTFVLNNDLRHPVVLAQDLATIDLVTDGRLEIGLGAGWASAEYEAAGTPFDPPGMRLARMEQAVEILKQAMRDGRIDTPATPAYPRMRLDHVPRSVQRPHPPLLVGGGGPRLLRFAAREADIVALNPRSRPAGGLETADVGEADVDRKIGWVREAAGERWARLEINVILFGVEPDYRRRRGPPPARSHKISEEELPRSPHYLTGDADEMTEQLLARRERWGISYVSMRPEHLEPVREVVRRLAGR